MHLGLEEKIYKNLCRASLVAQWLRICLPNAGDTGSSPGLGRSHMPQSNQAREPQLLSLRVWSLCSETREAAIVRGPRTAMKSGPHLPQLEKALAQKRRPNTAINKFKTNKTKHRGPPSLLMKPLLKKKTYVDIVWMLGLLYFELLSQ